MNTDEHGLKKRIYIACGEGQLSTDRLHPIQGCFTAARRLELICVYP